LQKKINYAWNTSDRDIVIYCGTKNLKLTI